MNRKKILWVAVPLFTVLGIGAAGAGYKHYGGRHNPERMVERISDKLDLSDDQRQKLEAVKDVLIEGRRELHDEREKTIGQIIAEVQKPQMDPGRIMDLIDERKARFDTLAPRLVGPIVEFHKSLSDEQRGKIVNLLETIRDWGWGHGQKGHG